MQADFSVELGPDAPGLESRGAPMILTSATMI
jgi:hypothetical protein